MIKEGFFSLGQFDLEKHIYIRLCILQTTFVIRTKTLTFAKLQPRKFDSITSIIEDIEIHFLQGEYGNKAKKIMAIFYWLGLTKYCHSVHC